MQDGKIKVTNDVATNKISISTSSQVDVTNGMICTPNIGLRSSDNVGMNEYLRNFADKIEMDLRAESWRGLSTPYSSMYRWAAPTEPSLSEKMTPEKIIRSGPMTIIFWKDGTKTKVRRTEGAEDDPYLAFCAGLAKKIYGNNSKVKRLIEEKTVEPKKRKKKDED